MKRIDRLTQAQTDRLTEIRDKWIRIGLCAEPADRAKAEEGLRLAYRSGGIDPPRKIVWTGSPLSNALVRAICRASVRDSVRDSVGDSVRESVRASGYGQHDAGWLGFFDAFAEFGLKGQTEKLRGLWMVAESAGWFLPHQNICWIAERPAFLRLEKIPGQDEFHNRLHCDDGPAIRFADGWEIYALHGVRMSQAEHAMDDPRKIIAVQNAEIRAALIRRMGMERMLAHLPHKSLSRSGDYELLSIQLSEQIADARYLKMKNQSVPGVWHLEGVHPTCQTVEHANNWRTTGDIHQSWVPEVLT